MSSPLTSIIIPCYNAAAWLRESVESALAQTWPAIEVIVVDDGSADQSLAVARGFEVRGVRVATQANRGAAAARNHGLRLARGDFVMFLDADDLLSPEAIAAQHAALVRRPGGIALGMWSRFRQHPVEAVFAPRPGWHDSDSVAWIKETWRDTEPMYQCGLFLIPRAVLARAGEWDERLSLIDDFEFFTRLVLASDGIVFTPAARLYYRSGLVGSLSRQKSRRAWESAVLSTNLAVDHLLAREDSPDTRHLSANMLQALLYSLYPAHADLRASLAARIATLGGANLPPPGGPRFQQLARLTGWRIAAYARHLLGRHPV